MQSLPPVDEHCGVIVRSREQAYDHLTKIIQNARTELCAFLSSYTLVITTDAEPIKAQRLAAKARGVKLRYITEITKDNLQYCKNLVDMVTELRHLDKIAANFILSDDEIGAAPIVSAEYPITYGYYSNVAGVLALYRGVFETLWQYSIPSGMKIDEFESGMQTTPRPPPSTLDNRKQRLVIDKFFFCKQCPWTSIFPDERLNHQTTTRHYKIYEFPIFD
ncbi:MAG: hypothetical protein ABI361_09360 [Nitrososphaera sp.]|jgi:hypothetical protein